jgi:hypothetical protein
MNHFEEAYLHIKAEKSIAIMEWKGLAKTDDYRKGFESFLQLLKNGKYLLWLFDYTDAKVIDVKDQKWTTGEWLPSAVKVLKGDLQKVAVIMSKDIFNKVAVRVIMTQIAQQTQVEVAYFDDKEDALDWLMKHETVAEMA